MFDNLVLLLQYSVLALTLAPFLIILPIIPGMEVYYWLLKPISLLRAFGYNLITLTIFLAIFIIFTRAMPDRILDFLPGKLQVIPGLICIIIVNLLFMHFAFKHPYKKLAAPVIINIIIILATILLLNGPVELGM